MYLIFLTYTLILSSMVFAQSGIQKIKNAEDSNRFFSTYGQTLFAHKVELSSDTFGDLNDTSNRIRKIPVSYISKLGIKEGSTIQSLNIDTNKKYPDYVFKNEVYVLLFHSNSASDIHYWNNFNLILSDDPKVHKQLSNDLSINRFVDGIGYVGKQRFLKSVPLENIELTTLSEKSALFNLPYLGGKDLHKKDIRFAKVLNSEVYVQIIIDGNQEKVFSPLLKSDSGKFYSAPTNNSLLSKDEKHLVVLNWFGNFKILYLTESGHSDRCDTLIFISNKEYSKVELPCADR